jgi:2-oxoglutarate ferredoxin oxidoreductase subunit alpha
MREYVDGATTIVRGAIDAGCTFFAGYPITPASGILMGMMRELPRVGGVAVQGEDEIASIGMCLGAAMAGAKAMTATSGPGMSLYSENIGLAIMGEVPLVIVDVQRLGPGTGAATTVAQGDVQFVRWGTAGGYPVIALAPVDVLDCYTMTGRAFQLAERYRCPVFVLTDKEVAMTPATVDVGSYPAVEPVRRPVVSEGPLYRFNPRHDVAPMRAFGFGDPVRFTGSTHDEGALITKNRVVVEELNRHLIAKIEDHVDEIAITEPDVQPGAETLVVAYGVTAGAARLAVDGIRASGRPVSLLIIKTLWPMPERALLAAMQGCDRVVVPELNPGLYRREVERIAGGREVVGLTQIDGELIDPARIMEAVR